MEGIEHKPSSPKNAKALGEEDLRGAAQFKKLKSVACEGGGGQKQSWKNMKQQGVVLETFAAPTRAF